MPEPRGGDEGGGKGGGEGCRGEAAGGEVDESDGRSRSPPRDRRALRSTCGVMRAPMARGVSSLTETPTASASSFSPLALEHLRPSACKTR